YRSRLPRTSPLAHQERPLDMERARLPYQAAGWTRWRSADRAHDREEGELAVVSCQFSPFSYQFPLPAVPMFLTPNRIILAGTISGDHMKKLRVLALLLVSVAVYAKTEIGELQGV